MQEYILRPEYVDRFSPDDMREAVTCYFKAGGKRLRPAVLLFCCGAVGGEESKAVSAAAAVEIFHTWTLVHDDIIDRDPTRRGAPTVHRLFADKPSTLKHFGEGGEARHYGLSVAVLAGDVQHGWGISLMTELTRKYGIDPLVTLTLINELDTRVLCTLVDGEMHDVLYSQIPMSRLSTDEVENMLWKKTGALFEFCAAAGAAIGLNTPDLQHPLVRALADFCGTCGSAFQLQDDILGITGNEKSLGKPVGSDIREGKRTTILLHAWRSASDSQRRMLADVIGNPDAAPEQVQEVTDLFVRLGSISFTADLARGHVEKALVYLEQVPASEYRELLADWAQLMIDREF